MAEEAQPTQSSSSSLLRVFHDFDCDGNGMITADELCQALHRLGFEAAIDEPSRFSMRTGMPARPYPLCPPTHVRHWSSPVPATGGTHWGRRVG